MDDIIHAKVATIEKCLIRIQEEFKADWKGNVTHQDALLLNLERATLESTIKKDLSVFREFSKSVINLDL